MDYIKIKAYGKINLGIDVLRKREDGYHDVSMIMQTVDLYDSLSIEKSNLKSISLNSNSSFMPTDHNNIVHKATDLFRQHFNITQGVNIHIEKNIPVAAGLGGGSADAAASLIALNQLFKTNASQDDLMHLGVQIGADVPFCILKGTALSEGIGEILTPLAPIPSCYILLVNPNISVSTPFVYNNLVLDHKVVHPNIAAMKEAIAIGSLKSLAKFMGNILETVTINQYPIIKNIKDRMIKEGALVSLMSGSGSTVFSIFEDKTTAKKAYDYFKKETDFEKVYLTKPIWP